MNEFISNHENDHTKVFASQVTGNQPADTVALSGKVISSALYDLVRIEAFLDTLVMITESENAKIAGCVNVLAFEAGELCRQAHKALDQATLDASKRGAQHD